ncbi:hypothetical protein U8607_24075 [Methylobacterium durans]|uniref:hypothetical protein n=1 Tax=Methylobacterium durans TaxID=2202825 RepID=UPI002AFEFE32|nr:hypothetical protein [Methylobacterium durans]MEA1835168.1 hypothetical protein [Methylobacterium durans]
MISTSCVSAILAGRAEAQKFEPPFERMVREEFNKRRPAGVPAHPGPGENIPNLDPKKPLDDAKALAESKAKAEANHKFALSNGSGFYPNTQAHLSPNLKPLIDNNIKVRTPLLDRLKPIIPPVPVIDPCKTLPKNMPVPPGCSGYKPPDIWKDPFKMIKKWIEYKKKSAYSFLQSLSQDFLEALQKVGLSILAILAFIYIIPRWFRRVVIGGCLLVAIAAVLLPFAGIL